MCTIVYFCLYSRYFLIFYFLVMGIIMFFCLNSRYFLIFYLAPLKALRRITNITHHVSSFLHIYFLACSTWYSYTYCHHSLSVSCLYSFQARINVCMRQMAEILYQIKGPLNQNSRNTAEADADNTLRPLMEFLDAKSVQIQIIHASDQLPCVLFMHCTVFLLHWE